MYNNNNNNNNSILINEHFSNLVKKIIIININCHINKLKKRKEKKVMKPSLDQVKEVNHEGGWNKE